MRGPIPELLLLFLGRVLQPTQRLPCKDITSRRRSLTRISGQTWWHSNNIFLVQQLPISSLGRFVKNHVAQPALFHLKSIPAEEKEVVPNCDTEKELTSHPNGCYRHSLPNGILNFKFENKFLWDRNSFPLLLPSMIYWHDINGGALSASRKVFRWLSNLWKNWHARGFINLAFDGLLATELNVNPQRNTRNKDQWSSSLWIPQWIKCSIWGIYFYVAPQWFVVSCGTTQPESQPPIGKPFARKLTSKCWAAADKVEVATRNKQTERQIWWISNWINISQLNSSPILDSRPPKSISSLVRRRVQRK